MTNQHPITPPPELALQWINEYLNEHPEGLNVEVLVVSAAQWGSDQELEACCEWLNKYRSKILAADLRYVRRPKPLSLKAQALELVDRIEKAESIWAMSELETIRRALEALPE